MGVFTCQPYGPCMVLMRLFDHCMAFKKLYGPWNLIFIMRWLPLYPLWTIEIIMSLRDWNTVTQAKKLKWETDLSLSLLGLSTLGLSTSCHQLWTHTTYHLRPLCDPLVGFNTKVSLYLCGYNYQGAIALQLKALDTYIIIPANFVTAY